MWGREGGRGEKLSVGLWDEIESVARVYGIYLHFFFLHLTFATIFHHMLPRVFVSFLTHLFVVVCILLHKEAVCVFIMVIEGDVPSSFIEGDVPPLLQISHQAVMSMCRAHKAVGDLGPTRELAVCLDPYSGLGLVLWILSG